jgi:hypothetical protein
MVVDKAGDEHGFVRCVLAQALSLYLAGAVWSCALL